MTKLLSVSSGKGGVGKTTVVSNLGAALAEYGRNTVVVDANLTTPSLGFHLGIPLYPKTLHDVLRNEAHISEATYVHNSGLRIVPAGLSVNDLKNTSPDRLADVLLDMVGEPDTVLIDSSAGLGNESIKALESSDEAMFVANPDLPSVTDALKAATLAEDSGTQVYGVILNRVRDHPSELSVDEVESMVGHPVISVIPEDNGVRESIAMKNPLVHHAPHSPASVQMRRLAASMAGVDFKPPKRPGLLRRLLQAFQ